MRPTFELADLQGRTRSVAEWDGKVLVLNFWATWCPPCRREIPTFVTLQQTYGARGLQFIGIAIDKPEPVTEFLKDLSVNYPVLVGGEDASAVSQAYGNRFGALPYSVVIDRSGKVAYGHQGELSRAQAEAVLLPLL